MKYIQFKARVRGIHKYFTYARITVTVQVCLYYPSLKKKKKIPPLPLQEGLAEGQHGELYTKCFEKTGT